MNSSKTTRLHRCLNVMLLMVLVAAFMSVSVSYSQPGNRAKGEIAFYKMTGPLQVFSLGDKRAQIDDLTWELTDDFRTKEIPREWDKKDTVEFAEREVWVYYYVSLLTEASFVGKKDTDKKVIKLITNPDEIEKLRELGGKIYKIERAPM